MKNIVFFLSITLILSCQANTDNTINQTIITTQENVDEFINGSNIKFTDLSNQDISDLELLGKIWGFLKYHHPEIAEGKYNWDYELFRVLPDYMNADNHELRETILLDWINGFGTIMKHKKRKAKAKSIALKSDHNWIKKDIRNKNLQKKLEFIYTNRHSGDKYYIKKAPSIGNPIFQNENGYENMPFPDDGYRLLAVYRLWNMINYFFPYRHLTDKDWNVVLREYIPVFINAQNELEYEIATQKLIGEINDTHAFLMGGNDKLQKHKGIHFAPFYVRFIENKLVVTEFVSPKFQNESKIKIGDVISKINGQNIDSIVPKMRDYYTASNEVTLMRNIAADILRSENKESEIEFIQDDKIETTTISLHYNFELEAEKSNNKKNKASYQMLENNIGYINLDYIENNNISKIKKELQNATGIIIDIRNYPNIFVPFLLGNWFVETETDFVKMSELNINNPGEFNYRNGRKLYGDKKCFGKKVIVLVNETSQSQAEFTAMAFRAGNNTTIIGSTTAGADGNISFINLPGGLKTMISGNGVYYPDGTQTQRIGIIPDIEIKPTINGIKTGRDELMEKAIEVILSE